MDMDASHDYTRVDLHMELTDEELARLREMSPNLIPFLDRQVSIPVSFMFFEHAVKVGD